MSDTLSVTGEFVLPEDKIFIQADWYTVDAVTPLKNEQTELTLSRKGQWTCKCKVFNHSKYTVKAR